MMDKSPLQPDIKRCGYLRRRDVSRRPPRKKPPAHCPFLGLVMISALISKPLPDLRVVPSGCVSTGECCAARESNPVAIQRALPLSGYGRRARRLFPCAPWRRRSAACRTDGKGGVDVAMRLFSSDSGHSPSPPPISRTHRRGVGCLEVNTEVASTSQHTPARHTLRTCISRRADMRTGVVLLGVTALRVVPSYIMRG